MHEIKTTKRAVVRIGYDGRVHKFYAGPMARERFANEEKVLRYLEEKSCPFVPRVLAAFPEKLYLVTTNCGSPADRISEDKMRSLYLELEDYGVRHNDPFPRNITYSHQAGRFCVIDFEFATILDTGEGLTLEEAEAARLEWIRGQGNLSQQPAEAPDPSCHDLPEH